MFENEDWAGDVGTRGVIMAGHVSEADAAESVVDIAL